MIPTKKSRNKDAYSNYKGIHKFNGGFICILFFKWVVTRRCIFYDLKPFQSINSRAWWESGEATLVCCQGHAVCTTSCILKQYTHTFIPVKTNGSTTRRSCKTKPLNRGQKFSIATSRRNFDCCCCCWYPWQISTGGSDTFYIYHAVLSITSSF